MPQLRVVAQLTTKPGSEEIIREALAKLAAATQSHRGCAEFKLYESATAPGTFVTVETWESQDDHDSHMQTEDIAVAIAASEGHIVGDITIHPLRPV
jgi:quinol monooxygenase YgiN